APPVAPVATTGVPSGVLTTVATVSGSVNPEGQATTDFFQYGATTSYGQSTPSQSVGSDNASHAVSTTLSGLAPSTTYHVQLVGTNPTGTTNGGDQSFATAPAVAPSATTSAPTSVTPTSVALNGTVNPKFQATTYFFQYGTTSQYGTSTATQSAG